MEKSLLDELREAKYENDTALIEFFNNGAIRDDKRHSLHRLEEINNKEAFKAIKDVLFDCIKCYSRHEYDFDTIDMELQLGLIYNVEDINNNQIKENAEPIDGKVRFYTASVKSILDGKQTNDVDFGEFCYNRQGFVDCDPLISMIKKSGLQYEGPESFEELKERILNGEKFNINVIASQLKYKVIDDNEPVKESQPEVKKSKRLSLFRR